MQNLILLGSISLMFFVGPQSLILFIVLNLIKRKKYISDIVYRCALILGLLVAFSFFIGLTFKSSSLLLNILFYPFHIFIYELQIPFFGISTGDMMFIFPYVYTLYIFFIAAFAGGLLGATFSYFRKKS